jgi:flagellar biosynthesis protein FlhG
MRTIHDVAHALGIEESRIRFFEVEFRDVFEAHGVELFDRSYTDERLSLLRRMEELVRGRPSAPEQVRRALLSCRPRPPARPRVLAVTSGKGGVGKTTIAVNLAIAFARTRLRVLLLDADLGLGNVHVFAGVAPRRTFTDLLEGRAALEEVMVEGPGGVRYVCGESGVLRPAGLDRKLAACLNRELARAAGRFDLVLVDTGAGLSPQVLDFLALADDIVVVATPNIASTLDAYGMVKVAREERFRGRLHLLVNQVTGKTQAGSVAGRISSCAERFLGFSPGLLGYLLQDPMVEWSNQERRPLLLSRPDSANAGQFDNMAAALGQAAGTAPAAGARTAGWTDPVGAP